MSCFYAVLSEEPGQVYGERIRVMKYNEDGTYTSHSIEGLEVSGLLRKQRDGKIYISPYGGTHLTVMDDAGISFPANYQSVQGMDISQINELGLTAGTISAHPYRIKFPNQSSGIAHRRLGYKHYELTDHLGNVRAVVSDRLALQIPFNYALHQPEVLSYTNYYPFGMLMPGRSYNTDSYRYGFQNQEMDDEIKGVGNSVNYKYRMYDPRIGRFFAVDPLASKYPYYSPYAFSGNDVIRSVELEGLEPVPASEIWKLSNLTTASISAHDINYDLGNKFAQIHGQSVILISITSGPNKGNFAGYVLNQGTNLKDFYGLFVQGKQIKGFDATLAYVVGGERVPAKAFGGDLGAVATGSIGLAALSSKHEFSSSLSGPIGVDYSNKVGQGYYSSSTGEWVSTFSVNESLKEIGFNWLKNVLDPRNYGPSHFSIKAKGSFSGWNSFQSDFSGTYLGPGNKAKAASGYLRSNPDSQAPLDIPIPEPASTENTQQR